jgi:hypothetical protein
VIIHGGQFLHQLWDDNAKKVICKHIAELAASKDKTHRRCSVVSFLAGVTVSAGIKVYNYDTQIKRSIFWKVLN